MILSLEDVQREKNIKEKKRNIVAKFVGLSKFSGDIYIHIWDGTGERVSEDDLKEISFPIKPYGAIFTLIFSQTEFPELEESIDIGILSLLVKFR